MENKNKKDLPELAERLNKQIHNCLDSKDNKDPRSKFQREYHKVIFSDYFRSLSNKTQVVPVPDNDHTHTRMSHSLEVACLGYDFGERFLKEIVPDVSSEQYQKYLIDNKLSALLELLVIIATGCLLHDIGNPPFGHSGEEAIQDFFMKNFKPDDGNSSSINSLNDIKDMKYYKYLDLMLTGKQLRDFCMFDGNANGFRVITRLAGKYKTYSDSEPEDKTGFNLSPITLAAIMKYPFGAGQYPNDENKKKFGYFQAEQALFDECKAQLNDESLNVKVKNRHPLVYLVEAADDICYTIMDFEDAIKNGHCRIADLWNSFNIDYLIKEESDKAAIEEAKKIIECFDPNKPIQRHELKALEVIRGGIIGLLVKQCFGAFINSALDKVLLGDVKTSLLEETLEYADKEHQSSYFKEYKKAREKYLKNSLFCHDRNMKLEISGYKVIHDLLTLFLGALSEYKQHPSEFDKYSRHSQYLLRYLGIDHTKIEREQIPEDDYRLCLMVTDFICQYSDKSLIRLHKSFTDFDI